MVDTNGASSPFDLIRKSPLLAVAVALMLGLAALLVWAEENQKLYVAQGSLLAIFLLLVIAAWDWFSHYSTQNNSGVSKEVPESEQAQDDERAIQRLRFGLAVGYLALVVTATRHDRWMCGNVARALGYGTLVAGASSITGVLVGFLFGFRPMSQSGTDHSSGAVGHPYTNLEEIADWLTKIILGAGLVELTNLVPALKNFGEYMARGVEPVDPTCPVAPDAGPPIALAITGFFFSIGILYGYLWSRRETLKAWIRANRPPDTPK